MPRPSHPFKSTVCIRLPLGRLRNPRHRKMCRACAGVRNSLGTEPEVLLQNGQGLQCVVSLHFREGREAAQRPPHSFDNSSRAQQAPVRGRFMSLAGRSWTKSPFRMSASEGQSFSPRRRMAAGASCCQIRRNDPPILRGTMWSRFSRDVAALCYGGQIRSKTSLQCNWLAELDDVIPGAENHLG